MLHKIKQIRDELAIGLNEAKQLLEENGTVALAIEKWQNRQAQLIALEKNKKYIEFKDWFYIKDFFIECSQQFFGDDHTISDKLKPLTENYSQKLWNEYVSEKHRHLMMVKSDDEWQIIKGKSFYREWNWETSWGENDYSAFEKNVKHRLDWDEQDTVYFFWGRNTSVETDWETLYKHWIPFMYEDEMNIVLNLKSQKVLIIGVNGSISIGERRE